MSTEVRVKDALTGGEKCSKAERFDLMPGPALEAVARVYGYGVEKYAERNWEKGYDWGLSIAALHRHIKAFERGESFDEESREHHLAHAVFHCLALMTWETNGLGTDSRTTLRNAVVMPEPKPQTLSESLNEIYSRVVLDRGDLKAQMRRVFDQCTPDGEPKDEKAASEAEWIKDHEYVERT